MVKVTPKLCAAVAVLAISIKGGSMYMRYVLEDRIGNMDVCKSSIENLLQHKVSVELLGEPITWRNPNLRNSFNHITMDTASIAIPVFGEKKKGTLLIQASKEESDTSFTINDLKLKVKEEEISIK